MQIIAEVVNKFLSQRFIIVFTRGCHRTLSKITQVHIISFLKAKLILSFHLDLGLLSDFFLWGLYEFISPRYVTWPTQLVLDFITLVMFGEEYKL
jgi:hypothetical protein